MKKSQFNALNFAASVGLGAVLLSACGSTNGGRKPGDDEFAVQELSYANASQMNKYPATISGIHNTEIRPQVSGFIVKLNTDEGDRVRKGQTLFEIDRTQYEAGYNQAKAAVASAEAALETVKSTAANKKMLHERKIISDFEYQTARNNLLTAEAGLAQAQAALVSARQNLDYCSVKSPSDGVLGTFPYNIGSLVNPGIQKPLTTVSQIGQVYVYFSMTEKQLLSMTKAGESLESQIDAMPPVKLELADGSIYETQGKITAISGVIDRATGSVTMRATFDNEKDILRSGGTANIIIPSEMKDVIFVPQWATQEIQDKKFVFVLQADSTIRYTEIQIAPLNDGKNYIVTEGLQAGDRIVVEGVQTLKDGRKIVPITPEQKKQKFEQALKDQREGNIASAFN